MQKTVPVENIGDMGAILRYSLEYMQRFLDNLRPRDLIAVLIVLGWLFLSWKGTGTMITAAALLVIGYYYGSEQRPAPPEPTK